MEEPITPRLDETGNPVVVGADWNQALGEENAKGKGFLVGADVVNRSKFLAERRTGIGGSDAAVVAGLSQYKTAYELWLEKTGQIQEQDLSDNKAVQFGIRLEALTIEWFSEKTGVVVDISPEAKALRRHPENPFMICHLDGDAPPDDAVEAKTAGVHVSQKFGEEGTDKLPIEYLIQCQHNLAVTGRKRMYVPVLALWKRDVIVFEVWRNEEAIDNLIRLETEFWENHVIGGDPPNMDFTSPHALEAVKRIYTGTNGQIIQLPDSAYADHLMLVQQKATYDTLDESMKALKARIQFQMGECSFGLFADGTGYVRSEREPQKAKKEVRIGDIVKSGYIDFRFSKEPIPTKKKK